jgi:ribosomal protein S18 acetylase RimI-like enzyme
LEREEKVVPLRAHQLGRAYEMMGRAFRDDPLLRYLVPDNDMRARLAPSFAGKVVRYCSLYGEVHTTPMLEGVACWLPPGDSAPTFTRMLRTGLLTEPLKFGWAGLRKFMDMVSYTEKVHKQAVAGPHWYLWGLGVEPSEQCKGIGGALMQPVLRRAGAEGLPCYLETQNERNLPFYERHGFEIVSDGEVPKRGLRVWAMVRAPLPAETSQPRSTT